MFKNFVTLEADKDEDWSSVHKTW